MQYLLFYSVRDYDPLVWCKSQVPKLSCSWTEIRRMVHDWHCVLYMLIVQFTLQGGILIAILLL